MQNKPPTVEYSEPSLVTGACLTTEHMSRMSKAYLINDNELESLGDIATHNAAGWSLATLSGAQIVAAIWDMNFSNGDAKFGGGWILFWAAVGLSSLLYTLARMKRRTALIGRIKEESSPPSTRPKQPNPYIPDSRT